MLALAFAATLVVTGFALSTLLIGLALTTTALGTLLPMLEDNGEMHTRFGALVLAIGAAGEFLPIVAITLLLSGNNEWSTSLLLIGFVVLAAGAAALALRPTPHRVALLLGRTLETSSQLPIRIAVLLVVLLVWVASRLSFDVDALTDSPGTMLRVPVFLLLFLVVRGIPTFVYHRNELGTRDRVAAALLASTALPVIVAITKIGLDRGDMKPENAAALIAAGMLSVLSFPAIAFALRRRSARATEPAPYPEGAPYPD